MAIQFTLSELSNLFAGELYADSDLVCRGATDHSSAVKAGELFFAIEGRTVDGHQFLNEAFERGAVAALVSRAAALG